MEREKESLAPSATDRFRAVRDGTLPAAFDAEEAADDLERARPRNFLHSDRAFARAQERGERIKLRLQLALLDVDFALAVLSAEREIVAMAAAMAAARSRRERRAA
jgi:hypothetical protein